MWLNFIVGGFLFVIIEYVVNTLNSPVLGALISMIPIGYLSVFIIDKSIINKYVKNIFFVVCFTLLTTAIFNLLLNYLSYNKYVISGIAIGIWILLQYLNYTLNPFIKDERKIVSGK
jgi:hypothetical protein